MKAVISGRESLAVVIDGVVLRTLICTGTVSEIPATAALISTVATAPDRLECEVETLADAEVELRRAWRQDRALHLTILLLDKDAAKEAKRLAVGHIGKLLDDPSVRNFVECRLWSAPLPSNGSITEALKYAKRDGNKSLIHLLSTLADDQDVIASCRAAWDRLARRDERETNIKGACALMVRLGVFRAFVRAIRREKVRIGGETLSALDETGKALLADWAKELKIDSLDIGKHQPVGEELLALTSHASSRVTLKHSGTPLSLPRDIVCLSHLRWGFVYQRPHRLLSRFARNQRVFFVEEPVDVDGVPQMDLHKCPESGVLVAVPRIPVLLSPSSRQTVLKLLLNNLFAEHQITDFVLWYYTPMALEFSRHLEPRLTVFDCMDELSAFADAPPEMKDREAELLQRADIVFTGGQSLYEAKVSRHEHVHCMPSGIELEHFAQSRTIKAEIRDQAGIPHPRIGYSGVIDERLDLNLLRGAAQLRPDWHFVMIGPVVKIDPATLPRLSNIHFLGSKSYKELPLYLSGWDVAILPFAHSESTRFISPVKTAEYLAGGLPVVSTSITDVVRPYGVRKLVRIADTSEDFVAAIQAGMTNERQDAEWLQRVDTFLAQNSWDSTFERMCKLMDDRLTEKERPKRISQALLKPTL